MSELLPTPVEKTKLSASEEDKDCPICQETRKPGAKILKHTKCGRWFDHECLDQWVKANSNEPACPMCRGRLDLTPRVSPERALRSFIASHKDRPLPTVQYVRDSVTTAESLFWEVLPAPSLEGTDLEGHRLAEIQLQERWPLEVSNLVHAEYRECRQAFETFRQGSNDQGPPRCFRNIKKDSETMISQQRELNFDSSSLRELWIHTNIFGVREWMLIQLDHHPSIGVWVPQPREYVISTEDEVQTLVGQARWNARVQHGPPSNLICIPLPTIVLYSDLPATRSIQEDLITGDYLNTHWAIVEFPPNPTRAYIIPWPQNKIREGMKDLTYPGWAIPERNLRPGHRNSATSTIHSTWDPKFDREEAKSFFQSLAF